MNGNAEFDWTNPENVWRKLHSWVTHNAEKIKRIHGLGYGWEPWLQADLADYMQQETKTVLKVHRETRVYSDLQRMDLTTWDYSSDSLSHCFEFKCRSEKIDSKELADGLRKDFEKLELIAVNRKQTRA